mgnify:CR=1 FL=1|tara:strand:+ start:20721 stop:22343 length:1623 start_codon:yes stop_codon:yes gene_type:complete
MATNKYIIEAKTKGFDKASKKTKGLGSSMGALTKSVGGVALAYFSARGLINAVSGSIKAFGEQEKAEKKLETAIGRTSKSLLEHASALQQQTIYGDEAIIGVQASIGAFIKNEDHIKASTEATLDLASALGMDLKGAGDLIAKTLGSSTNALSRYGIEVKGAVGSSERLESLTKNISNVFGGQASAEAKTFSGQMDQLKNTIGDTAEKIGELLIPVVLPLADGLKWVATRTSDIITAWEKFGKAQEPVNTLSHIAIKNFNDEARSLSDLENALLKTKDAIKTLIPESTSYNDALKRAKNEGGETWSTYQKLKREYDDLKSKIKEGHVNLKEGTIAWAEYKSQGLNPSKLSFIETKESVDEFVNSLQKIEPPPAITELTGTEKLKLFFQNSFDGSKLATMGVNAFANGLANAVVEGKNLTKINLGELFAKMVLVEGLKMFITGGLSKVFPFLGHSGGLVTPTGIKKFHSGGSVDGEVPAILQSGEFVMQRSAVESIGVERLREMNDGGGGITLNITAPLVDDTVVDSIIPALNRAYSEGRA